MKAVEWVSNRSRSARVFLLGVVLFVLSNALGGIVAEDTIQFALVETLGTFGLLLTLGGIAWLYFNLDASPQR